MSHFDLNLLFDGLAALISISDVATDVIVTYNFWINDEMVFFWLSIAFIILAQISYAFAFVIVVGNDDEPVKAFLLFLCILPFSPILSFVFYLTEDSDSWLSKWLKSVCCFRVRFVAAHIDANKSKLKQWMKKKLRKHLGFIMESMIEAFPQSIIQISAIVVHGNANVISIISILISMLSVSSKAFIFAIQFSANLKSLLFIWIGAVTDFIGIFFAISWVLYDSDIPALSTLSFIWQIKVCVCVVPLVLCFSVFLYANGLSELLNEVNANSIVACCFGACCAWLVVQILWCFGMALGTMGLEIATFIFLAPPIMYACSRIPSNEDQTRMYFELVAWIMQGRSQNIDGLLSFSTKRDRIIRTCIANKVIMDASHGGGVDGIFRKLIDENHKSSYMDIATFETLRTTHENRKVYSEDVPEFWHLILMLLCIGYVVVHDEVQWVGGAHKNVKKKCYLCGAAFSNFGIAPFYFLSRVFNMLFPFLIIITLYSAGYDVVGGDDIDLFQRIMLWLYVAFIALLAVIAVIVYREQFYLWHILPGKSLPQCDSSITLGKVTSMYSTLIAVPVRDALLHKTLGSDIAKIIILYCNAIDNAALMAVPERLPSDQDEVETENERLKASDDNDQDEVEIESERLL